MSKVSPQAMDSQVRHERQCAVRALLMRPMLRANGSDAEAFGLVRTHAEWLREWFGKQLGWTLHVDTQVARLGKTPAEPVDSTRPARDPDQGVAFTRARYVLFCLALAGLERGERQTTLGNLARELNAAIQSDPTFESKGIRFDLSQRECRKDLVHVILLLIHFGVIVRLHGDESQYVADRGDVLYTVHRSAISAMLNIRRGPSSIQNVDLEERISLLLEEPLPHTEDGWYRYVRTRLARKLVDDPLVYYDSLDPDEKTYLDSQRPSLLKNIEEGTGLIGEVRAEGIAMVDEQGDLTDMSIPCEGTEGHFTLLIAEYLSSMLRAAPGAPVGLAELESKARELIERFGQYWRKGVRDSGAEKALLFEAVSRLEALRLVRTFAQESILPLPAIARYAVATKIPLEDEML